MDSNSSSPEVRAKRTEVRERRAAELKALNAARRRAGVLSGELDAYEAALARVRAADSLVSLAAAAAQARAALDAFAPGEDFVARKLQRANAVFDAASDQERVRLQGILAAAARHIAARRYDKANRVLNGVFLSR